MRVLYIHQHFSTPTGKTATRSYEAAKRLVERGHEVTMLCGSNARGDTGIETPFRRGVRKGVVDGIEVIELALPYANRLSLLKRTFVFLRYALRSSWYAVMGRYDLVFSTSTPLTAGIPGIAASLLRRRKFVFEVRDLWPELPREMGVIRNPILLAMMSALEWASYRSADACVGLSPGIVRGIEKRSVDSKQIAMVPNGCDLDLFDCSEAEAIRPPGVSTSDTVAIFTGAHGPANGLDAVLAAARELLRLGRDDIKIVLMGEGKLKQSLMESAKKDNVDNVIFLESRPKYELARYFAGANIGLQILANIPAFYYGTSPNKFFDYLSSGLPVVTNYPGWIAELIQENECGRAVPPDNPQAFAETLIELADSPQTRVDMGKKSRILAKDQFDRDHLMEQLVSTIESARPDLNLNG